MSCLVVSPVAGCVMVAIECSLVNFELTYSRSFSSRLAAVHNPIENNVAHLLCERFGVAVYRRAVPSVDPVDHAKQAHDRGARVEIEAAPALEVFHQPETDAVVLTLDASDLRTQAVLQRVVFMREYLQTLLIAHKIFEVVQDEDADPLFGIGDILEPRFELFENGRESVLLNQKQQTLFGLEIVIEPRQRHPGGTRKIAHGSAFVSLEAENLGGMIENLPEAAVKTGHRRAIGCLSGTPGSKGCG